MTYCLSLLCREGIVFISDSRTSAGVDNITIQPKMRVFAEKGERVICLMTSGNLGLRVDRGGLAPRKDGAGPWASDEPADAF